VPNWRERLVCIFCEMNNRQRLIGGLIKQHCESKPSQQIYFMEQVTPIYKWAQNQLTAHNIQGSEYCGHEYASGTVINSIRHENIESLSFSNNSLDFIISNDVFEHVPNYAQALAECARVLKTGGMMLATIPFHPNNDASIPRALLKNGAIEHLLPPVYHGNPMSEKGSLVFTDFGWDIFSTTQQVGFNRVCLDMYLSRPFGHLGEGLGVFKFIK